MIFNSFSLISVIVAYLEQYLLLLIELMAIHRTVQIHGRERKNKKGTTIGVIGLAVKLCITIDIVIPYPYVIAVYLDA